MIEAPKPGRSMGEDVGASEGACEPCIAGKGGGGGSKVAA